MTLRTSAAGGTGERGATGRDQGGRSDFSWAARSHLFRLRSRREHPTWPRRCRPAFAAPNAMTGLRLFLQSIFGMI